MCRAASFRAQQDHKTIALYIAGISKRSAIGDQCPETAIADQELDADDRDEA
jgi:hypothetical protein